MDVSRRITLMVATAAILIPLLAQLGASPADANIDIYVRSFSNGSAEALIGIPYPGSVTSHNFSFQTGLRVVYAYFNISGLPYTSGGTDCPEHPGIDLGNDGTSEWSFIGTGYGRLGHQYMFSDGNQSFSAVFGPSGGTNDIMSIRLPAGAKVSSASVTLTPSGFSGPLNVSFDIGADNFPDWTNAALSSATTIMAIESVLSAYVSSAAPSGTDTYGVSYVDVPVRVSCGSAATLSFSGLNVSYTCILTTRNLAADLDMLIPDMLGTGNVSIPMAVIFNSSGKLRIWDIRIRTQPPAHSPGLLDPRPPPDPVMDEDSSLNFSVTPVDIYGNPFSVQWSLDTTPVPGANGSFFVFNANFSSSGRHTVTVSAANDLAESQYSWWVTVRDVNRAPVVEYFSPSEVASVAETSALVFNASARDPDGDQISYTWKLDGRQQGETSGSLRYQPSYGSVGQHVVDVTVRDGAGLSAFQSWCVTVLKTNVPPAISSFSPANDATMKEGQILQFAIAATDINGDLLSYEWVVDGFHADAGNEFKFSPDFNSSGIRDIRAIVTDGEFTVQRSWNITVLDVNHPPQAQIDGPLEGSEFLDGDTIRLSATLCTDPDLDVLTLSWRDGDIPLGNGSSLNISLSRGQHLIRLNADDGRGGRDERAVNITVRTIRLNMTAKVSPAAPVAGARVKMTIRVIGEGDAAAQNLSIEFFVDGVPSGSQFVPRVEPGDNFTHTFTWTAERGSHELMVIVGNQTMTRKLSVLPSIPEWFYPLAFILGALTISVGTAAGYFFYLSWMAPKGRGRRPRKRVRKNPFFSWGLRITEAFEHIRLENAPYKDRPIQIQTTIPEGITGEYLIAQELSAKRKWWMPRRQSAADAAAVPVGPPAPAPDGLTPPSAADGSSVAAPTEGAFSSSVTPVAVAVENGLTAPEAPAAGREKDEPTGSKKPRKRIKDIEDRILALERKGSDVASARRFLSLARSFWKGGNTAKAEQYFDKAEIRLHELEEEVKGIPLCPNCGATVESAWSVCPECEEKLQ